MPDALKTVVASTAAPSKVLKVGERELGEHIADGFRFHLVAGIPSAGKTQLLASYEAHRARQREGTFLNRFRPHEGKVLATAPGSLNCYPIPGSKAMFVDASGEDFKELYPQLRRSGRVAEADVGFLRTLVGRLDGLVLLLDLRLLWQPEGDERQKKEQTKQVEILTWVLMLLRWLEHDGKFPRKTSQDFADYVNRQVHNLGRKRLSAPVTLLFSRADEAMRLTVPSEDHSWMTGAGTERRLFPPGEQPFFFAYHCLGEMFGALKTHARHFRIDFAHSLRVDAATGGVIDPHPMGLFPAVEWMLTPRWKRRLTVPTRHLMKLQRFLDRFTGRSDRWRRLPDPEKVQR